LIIKVSDLITLKKDHLMDNQLDARLVFAKDLARSAGQKAMVYFQTIGDLVVEQKGAQDLVSNADKDVETYIRAAMAEHFPDDGIVGEEQDNVVGTSGYTWVIDPIDGTANFLTAIPAWCIVLACVHDDQTKLGVVFEPSHNELFWAAKGQGAYLNEAPMKVASTTGLDVGSTGVGMNGRTETDLIVHFIAALVAKGGIFYRNASGALMLAYVAAGRLIGYSEPHMNAWDCLAAQLLISEAGGRVEQQSADLMLVHGGRVVVGTPDVFDELVQMSDDAFNQ
jgi:myo-inositol-1(or 4)-monophosphatase